MDDHDNFLLINPFEIVDFEINDKFELIQVDQNSGPERNKLISL